MRTPTRRRPRRRVGRPLPAGPTHIHTVASDGIADVISIIEHVVARGEPTSSPSPTTNASTKSVGADRSRAIAASLAEVIIGEEVTTLGGHLLAPFIERRIKPYRGLGRTIADIHEAGGIAIPAHPLVPYLLCARGGCSDGCSTTSTRRSDRCHRDVQPDGARATVARSGRALRRRASAGPDRRQRRPRPRRSRRGLDDVPGTTAAELRAAVDARTTDHGGPSTGRSGQVGVFGQQIRKRAIDARDEVAVGSEGRARAATTATLAVAPGRRGMSHRAIR